MTAVEFYPEGIGKQYAYEYYETKEQQSNRTDNRGNGSNIYRTDTTSVPALDIGTVQQNSGILFDSWNSIVRNTDLISKLPTQESLDEMMMYTVRDNLLQARRIMDENMKSIQSSAKVESSNQTQRLKEMMHKELKDMMDELKAKDLTPWKLKLKWAAVGAILPSMLCILQLILR